MNDVVRGYKVFEEDWTCRGFQYTCPGIFEENVDPELCKNGFHFCTKAVDVFYYYPYDQKFHVAEVEAIGKVVSDGKKSCTDKIKIVREIPWHELLSIINTGNGNTGYANTGDGNTGNWNTGHINTGDGNTGNWNTGNKNTGNGNTGYANTGDRNTGYANTGDGNTGDGNTGNWNTGNKNTGDGNTGYANTGNKNTGDWNNTDRSSGCFCTLEPRIDMFNKRSSWTYNDWQKSKARSILNGAPGPENNQIWWDSLIKEDKKIVMDLPNFNPDIFKEITGIDIH